MTDQKNALAQLFSTCWKDDELKARFMKDPIAVLAEHGIDIPENLNVNVVENTDKCVHITLPQAPGDISELSDEELAKAAGGGSWDSCGKASNCTIPGDVTC